MFSRSQKLYSEMDNGKGWSVPPRGPSGGGMRWMCFQKASCMENRLETRKLQDRLSELRSERQTVGKKKIGFEDNTSR